MRMFNRFLIFLWLFLIVILTGERLLSAQSTSKTALNTSKANQIFVPDEIVIKTRPDVTLDEITSFIKSRGAKILDTNSALGLYRLMITEQVEKATLSYKSHSSVLYARPNYILAEIGGRFITLFDLELRIQRMLPMVRQRFTDLEAREDWFRSLVKDKLFSLAAKDENLQHIPDLQSEINEAIDRALVRIYKRRIKEARAISEKEIIAFYEENIEKYQTPEQIRGRHILVKSKEEAEEILKSIKAGNDFGKLARERSIDPTGQNGGTLEWVSRGRMPAATKEVFVLQKGEVSEIITTHSGYNILQVEDKRASRQMPFSDVKDRVKKNLVITKQKEAIDKKKKELEERYQVKLNPEFLSEIRITVTENDIGNSIIKVPEIIKEALETHYQ